MSNVKGRNVRIEVATTFGAPKSITAVSNANPGIATSVAHGLADGTAGFLEAMSGMEQLNDQAARVDAPATDTFALQGLNTTSVGTFVGPGTFTPATAWLTIAEATAYDIGGGAGNKLDATRLIDNIKQEDQGDLAAQTLNIKLLAQTVPSSALLALEAIAQAVGKALVRVTFSDGAVRLAYGEPSMSGESVSQGALGTGSIDFTVKGYVLKLAA